MNDNARRLLAALPDPGPYERDLMQTRDQIVRGIARSVPFLSDVFIVEDESKPGWCGIHVKLSRWTWLGCGLVHWWVRTGLEQDFNYRGTVGVKYEVRVR